MRNYTLTELFTLSRNELFALHAQIFAALTAPNREADNDIARGNLRRIRRVLANAKLTL